MLTYQRMTTGQDAEFLALMRREAADYLDQTLELMQMTPEQFQQLFATIGQVYGIYQDSSLAGFYWIEQRERVLYLHGLVLVREFQGKGIGRKIMTMLAVEYKDKVDTIELGVHESNTIARSLYQKLGYQTVNYFEELGFYVMQHQLAPEYAASSV